MLLSRHPHAMCRLRLSLCPRLARNDQSSLCPSSIEQFTDGISHPFCRRRIVDCSGLSHPSQRFSRSTGLTLTHRLDSIRRVIFTCCLRRRLR